MKKIFSITAVAALCLLVATISGCGSKELDTDQYAGKVALSAIAPNPVMRGANLTILGTNLEKVTEVRFTGGVSTTEFTVEKTGDHGSLSVKVPVEGPEVGPVSIVTSDGKVLTTLVDLTFTEPIVLDSFSPSVALSGDRVTVKGDYLNDVMEVILGNDVYVTEFDSRSRYELSFTVPSNATTGYIILGDVNQLEDENTIPNLIYSETELTISDPTVDSSSLATYKAGDLITVTGAHLDMIESINLEGASDVDFEVSSDGSTITFYLPAKATDGNITLVSYAGAEFVAGEISTVTVGDLAIASLADDGRYKAGDTVKISGDDLDLVTKVEFTGAEASWYFDDGSIFASVPVSAKDGSVTLTLDSGKQAFTDAIEVVKPVITAIDKTAAATGDEITLTGTDLDLVTDAKIGDKANGFIDCSFYPMGETKIVVILDRQAYTGPITLTADSGYETLSDIVEVSYNEPVDIVFTDPSYALGKPITITGEDLLLVESISLRGKKVTTYYNRANDAMSFAIPDELGPGVYRLDLVLLDGTELTWPVPFEITASYTEVFIWQGSEDLGTWSNQPYLGADGALADLEVAVGDVIRIYYTPYADWWQFQIYDGHWGGMSFPELDGGNTVTPDNTESGSPFFSFEVTEANIGQLTTPAGWGGTLLCQGESVIITGVSLVQYGAVQTVVWEGSLETGDYANNLEIGGEDDWVDNELYVGATVRIYFTAADPEEWSMQLFTGHWAAMNMLFPGEEHPNQFNQDNSPSAISDGFISFEVTEEIFNLFTEKQWWGSAIIVQGKFLTVTKISFM